MFCPFCDSYALIPNNFNFKLDPNDSKYIKSTMTCTNGHKFCSCGIALHEGECYKDNNDFQKYLINEGVKQCPKCGFYIKKAKGCNHMTCGNAACRYEFCWLCMQEAVPGHFQFGKCKGMQFVDTKNCMYKLKQRMPFLYYIIKIIESIIRLSFLILIPSIFVFLIFNLILLGSSFPPLFKNNHQKILYILAVGAILFSLNNVFQCCILFLLSIFIIGLVFKIIFFCCELLNSFRSLFTLAAHN